MREVNTRAHARTHRSRSACAQAAATLRSARFSEITARCNWQCSGNERKREAARHPQSVNSARGHNQPVARMLGRGRTFGSAQRCLQLTQGARDLLEVHISSNSTERPVAQPATAHCVKSWAVAPTASGPAVVNDELATLDFHRGGEFALSLSPADGVTCVAIHVADGSDGKNRLAYAPQPCVGWTLVKIAGERPRWSTPALVLAQIQLAPAGPVALTWRTNGIKQPKLETAKAVISPLKFQAARIALAQALSSELGAATLPPSPEQFDEAVGKLRRQANEHAGDLPTKPHSSFSAVLSRSPLCSPGRKTRDNPP